MAEIYNNLTEEQKKDLSDYANNAKIDVKKDGVEPRPEPETPSVDDAKDYVDTRISGAAGQIYKDGAQAYSDLDNRIASNTARIDTLEQDMKAMGNKMLDLEDRMDGVVATSHAITNARPMVQNEGEFALGFGMGAAGSKQALAFGGAYQFNQSWSASTTVNYETAGKRSTSQISAGAGVHYKFK
ncbi:high-affinity choline uptake protein BetT [Vibrio maritimus]|uniref:High-affinity choline uptake protein BetT n=1 Tax=Vibrio maritimus TaxID=990268 RepID=A0A090SH99_9VIBR|nr:high-affinity choline uptake protein BetT [Vibrio maritimus]